MSALRIDIELLEEARAAATAHGMTVDEFVAVALRAAIQSAVPRQGLRNGLPTMIVNGGTPAIDPAKVRQSIQEDGF